MGLIKEFSEWIQRFLEILVQTQPLTFFAVLFAIIFVETGLVVWPFLPGDSLLFFVGYLVHQYSLSFPGVLVLLVAAALLGDNVNYRIGSWLGPRVFQYEKSWLFNRKHLLKAQAFYDKYGAKMILMARFVPIVRTFAPFIAGIGKMGYQRFWVFNCVGAAAWVPTFLLGGYYFGNIAVIKRNFHFVIGAILVISVMPMVVDWYNARRRAKQPVAPEITAPPAAERVEVE